MGTATLTGTLNGFVRNGGFLDLTLDTGTWDVPDSDSGRISLPIRCKGDLQGGQIGVFAKRSEASSFVYICELTVPGSTKVALQDNTSGNTHVGLEPKTIEVTLDKLTAINAGSGDDVIVRLVPRDSTEYEVVGATVLKFST